MVNQIDYGDNYTFLNVGIQTVEIRFSGMIIENNGVDGPYNVELYLYNSGDFFDFDTHMTAAYNRTDFQRSTGFEPPHTDYGLDIDSDGQYEFLAVDVAIYIANAGDYAIQGYLMDGFWNTIEWDANTTFLEVGIQAVELKFSGIAINNLGIDGPYIVNLYLYGDYVGFTDSDTHVTAAYNFTDFQSGSHFEPPHADYGLDTDSDGLYNYLVADVVVNVSVAGNYMVQAYLYDNLIFPTFLGEEYHEIFFSTGIQTIELRFSGVAINASGLNGPYFIDLDLYDDTSNSIDLDIHITSAYNWTDFQTPPKFEPPHTDYGLDTDSDGLFNHLVIDIVINVSIQDNYLIRANLYDNYSCYIEYNLSNTFLNAGIQTVEIIYDGILINLNEVNGPYYVELNIYTVDLALLDSESYTTYKYNWTDFETPPGFEPPHADYGLDTDSDGLYNYLVIEAVVNLSSAGDYKIYANLYDNDEKWISGYYNETFLNAGIQTVEIRFSGMRINNCEFNGTYFVNLMLDDVFGFVDSDTHVTSTYYWTDFQTGTKFEPPHTDYGIDTDSDGLYDYIILEAVVDVYLAGEYEIYVHLQDMYMSWIAWDYNYTFRNVGIQTVEFRFDGASINKNGVDGPYEANLYLHEGSSLILLDSDTHYTFAYNLTDFPDHIDPIAEAGADRSVDEDTNVTFDGSGSKDNMGIDNYTWTFVDGTLQTLYGMNPTYCFSEPDIYNVTLTVRDAAGNSDTDYVTIIVVDVTPPTAYAGPDRYAGRNLTFTFDGSGSTDNSGIINYTWTFFDGAPKTLYGVNPTYTFRNLSQYNVTLTVRDTVGLTDSDNATIAVIIDTTPPIANAGSDRTVDEDTVVTFDGSGSTDNVGIVNYTWTFNDGGPQTLYGVSPTYTFATPGEYTITLRVTDAADNSNTITVTIQVADITSPVANIGEDQTIQEGDTVTFDASNSTDNIGIVNYSWTFSANNETITLYGVTATYKFQEAGEYEVTLIVKDAAGLTDTDTITITVEEEESAWTAFVKYWWITAIIIVAIAALILTFMLMRREKGKKKQQVLVERQPPTQGEEIPPPHNK